MYKIRKTYEDYDGVERTEDFYFSLSKAEMLEMMADKDGDFEAYINKIIDAKETSKLIKLFKDLVFKAYGEKSEDGRRFIKSKEISKAFSETVPYSDIFMELATDDIAAANFINGILPSDIAEELKKDEKKSKKESK